MRLSARALNRATLGRQLLLGRQRLSVGDAVRQAFVLQAQEPASPFLALWNRVDGFEASQLSAAFVEGAVVKSSLVRLTLHAVHAEDYAAVHRALMPSLRGSRLNDRRLTETGLSAAQVDALLPELLEFAAEPRTSAELEGWFAERVGPAAGRALWATKMFAPLHHVPTGGPWSFGETRSVFVATPAGSVRSAVDEPAHAQAVQALLVRYLEAFGPATAADFAQFSILRRPVVAAAVDALGDALVRRLGPDGELLLDVPDGLLPDPDGEAAPRLLPMWDSPLLAYADRGRVLPADVRGRVVQRNGDVLPAVLVDGHVRGVWRVIDGVVEVSAFERLADEQWSGLADEATALQAFLADRDPAVYRRYHHWWAKGIAAAEVVNLGG